MKEYINKVTLLQGRGPADFYLYFLMAKRDVGEHPLKFQLRITVKSLIYPYASVDPEFWRIHSLD